MAKNSFIKKNVEPVPFTPESFEEGEKRDCLDAPESAEVDCGREDILRKAYEEGFSRGLEEGREKIRSTVARIEAILDELESIKEKKVQELLPEIVDLSLEIARKIIRKELSVQRDVVLGVVRDALKKVGEGEEKITIKVNPEDYEVLVANFEEVRNNGRVRKVEIEPAPDISPGGCYIETERGDVDARIEEQLREIEDALRKAND